MDKRFQPVAWLQEAGYKAYLVGNQVRAILAGRSYDPKDIDIATSALPEAVAGILRRHSILPAQLDATFGVVTFELQGNSYEITTFRSDVYDPQFDHIKRKPSRIEFTDDLTTDALRRDFTINAIYLNPVSGHYLDPLSGRADLKNKTLRFIGDPEIRIKEDPLRVLRAIRFKHSLGLHYAPATRVALGKLGRLVHKLSNAILKKEFQKIQNLEGYAAARREMQAWGIISRL
ncbi:hypothetical protein A2V68_00315 [candidate division Kazan bacterium RBG_13_50_9]|uniref:Poly A polymerase head domain-containing protein n=1 Tax=candidate division Kazan bacterium RBG_13_50_9 TaxID=1798535 RepID=A0A1F4NS62_UNCK3|nr:MAG: hypothetical protein A2V68_00315 [candidate division Kazan bacterium RBG_13_50_9]